MFFILTPFEKKPSLQTITSFILLSDGVLISRSQAVSQRRKTIWLTIREAQLSPPWKGQLLQTGVHMLAEDEEKEAHGTS